MTKIIIDITKEDLSIIGTGEIFNKIIDTLTDSGLQPHKDFSAYISEEMTPKKKKTPLYALKEIIREKKGLVCPLRLIAHSKRADIDPRCIKEECAWYLICYNLSNLVRTE